MQRINNLLLVNKRPKNLRLIKPVMGIGISCEGRKMKCTECGNKFIRLKLIESTREQLCDSCFESKGRFEYMGIIKMLDEEFPGAG